MLPKYIEACSHTLLFIHRNRFELRLFKRTEERGMTSRRRTILFMLILSSGISVLWGFALQRSARGVIGDYKIVYYGARCMVQHCDPYNETQLMRVYEAEGGERPSVVIEGRTQLIVASQMYLPTAAIYIAPFGLLPWGIASLLWTSLTVGGMTIAAFLMWDFGES